MEMAFGALDMHVVKRSNCWISPYLRAESRRNSFHIYINRTQYTQWPHDAFRDLPFSTPYSFTKLHEWYPDTKFVLTVRSSGEAWAKSYMTLPDKFKNRASDRVAAYGVPSGLLTADNMARFHDAYADHAMGHIRSDRLLVMDLAAGDGFRELCMFMGVPLVNRGFPNIRGIKKKT
jgi:hypothetical protein